MRVPLSTDIVGKLCINGGIPADSPQVVAQKGVVLGGLQLLLHSGTDVQLIQMVVDILDAAELLDQLPGPLGANTRHAGDAVGGVPLDGLDVDHLPGAHAVVLLNLGHIVQGHLGLAEFRGGQPHGGGITHQLQAVPVTGGNHTGDSLLLALGGEGAQDIIGLPALAGDDLEPQISQQFLEHRQLLSQLFRHALAVGLVPLIGLVAKGGTLPVKGNGHTVRGGLLQQLVQHGEKPVNAVGVFPGLGGQQLDAVKGPVENAVAVQH